MEEDDFLSPEDIASSSLWGGESKLICWEDLSQKLCLPIQEVHCRMRKKEEIRQWGTPNISTVHNCRATLVGWMVEVGGAFGFHTLTIHISVALVDRLLCLVEIPPHRLQLVACGAILIAAKLEEDSKRVPSAAQLNYCSDDSFTPDLILKTERWILNQLHWDLSTITPLHFLGIYSEYLLSSHEMDQEIKIQAIPDKLVKYCHFFVSLILQEAEFSSFLPSILACASVALSRKILKISPIWSENLSYHTHYQYEEILPCINRLSSVYQQKGPQPTAQI